MKIILLIPFLHPGWRLSFKRILCEKKIGSHRNEKKETWIQKLISVREDNIHLFALNTRNILFIIKFDNYNVHFLLQIIWIVSFIEYLGIHVGKCTRETWIILKMYKVLHPKQNHHSWLYLTLSAYIYKKKMHFIIYFAPISHLVTFLRNLKQRAFIYCVLKICIAFNVRCFLYKYFIDLIF